MDASPEELRAAAKVPLNDRTIDSVMYRKTRYGAWKERYFRTHRHTLYYYSTAVNEIKANAMRGHRMGPYKYKAVGAPSERIDLRSKWASVALEADGLTFALKYGQGEKQKLLEVRAESTALASEWVSTLRAIILAEKAKRKEIGRLTISVIGGYVIGDLLTPEGGQNLELQASYDGFEEVSKASRLARLKEDVAYENVDLSEEGVYALEDLQLEASFSVFQSHSSVSLRLRQTNAPTGRKKRSTVAGRALELYSGSASDSDSHSVRRMALYELQSDAVADLATSFGSAAAASAVQRASISALDGDCSAAQAWPPAAPDGAVAQSGYKWLALFEKDVSEHVDGAKALVPKVRAILHARVKYAESLIQCVDPDGHARYEVCDDGGDEFKLEVLAAAMSRLGGVADKAIQVGGFLTYVLQWKEPRLSFFAWLTLMVCLLSLPLEAGLCVCPLFMLIGLFATLPKLLSGELRHTLYAGAEKRNNDEPLLSQGGVRRERAELHVQVLRARNLSAADTSLVDGSKSSDPYVAVISVPPAQGAFEARPLSPMLIGVSSVKQKSLNPIWSGGSGEDDYSEATFRLSYFDPFSFHSEKAEASASDVGNFTDGSSTSQNASKLSSANVKIYGNGDCIKPPVDFRTKPQPENGFNPGDACWTFAVLQEVDRSAYHPKLRPWAQSQSKILLEVLDRDVTETDDFLGCADLDLADLANAAAKDGGIVQRWLDLKPCSVDSRNKSIANVSSLGAVEVRARLRFCAAGDGGDWRDEQRVFSSLLEPTVEVADDKKSGYVGQYKSVTRSMKNAQDLAVSLAEFLECAVALCTWVHPEKTLLVACGLLAGVVAACLVPNTYCVAALISKLFIKGLALKLKGIDASCPTPADQSETQLCNLLASLPSQSAERDAFRLKRQLWAAQHARAELRVQVDLHCAFRVRCQLKVWYYEDAAGKWVQSYVVCANGLLLVYASLGSASENKKPSHTFVIAGSAERRAVADLKPKPAPPSALHVISLATRSEKVTRIRDVFMAIKPQLVDSLVSAVDGELEAQSGGEPNTPNALDSARQAIRKTFAPKAKAS